MKTKEECLLRNGVFKNDLNGYSTNVMKAMDEYASQFQQDSDLRAKEAVEKFARELIAQSETWQNQSGEVDDVVSVDDIQLSVVHAIGSSQLESKKGGGE
mgnify:CR=1 FL=1